MRQFVGAVLICLATAASTQHIGFGIGGNVGTLTFQSRTGSNTQEIKGMPGVLAQVSYSQDLGKKISGFRQHSREVHQLLFAAGYQSLKLEDVQSPIQSNWTMQYVTSKLAVRTIFGGNKKTSLFGSLGASADFLVGGTQVIGFTKYDITQSLMKHNLGALAELGLHYSISGDSYTTIAISYHRGLSNLEKDPEQKAQLHSWQITMAIHFKK